MIHKTLRFFGATTLVGAVIWASACGGSDSSAGTSAAGTGAGGAAAGSAGSAGNQSGGSSGTSGSGGSVDVTCGSMQCLHRGVSTLTFPACCPTGTTDTCGLDSSLLAQYGPSFADPCLPLHEPGVLDTTCPDRTVNAGISITFPGCCRAATGTCGYNLDSVMGLVTLDLGCVDSSPFVDGGVPQSCGDGGVGAAGAPN
ncbi:MAG TPA: hypothetical protein VGI10_29270 [Polyangiaceae bacterium]|jgi:hypothetical protein